MAYSGWSRRNSRTGSTGQPSTRLQLASRSGTTTVRPGFSTLAVSAMNQTPQNAITSPENSLPDPAERDHVAGEFPRLARQLQAVADHVGQFLYRRFLVMMRQQNRPALLLQFQNLVRNGKG